MKRKNDVLMKYILITSTGLVVNLVLYFIYRTQATLEAPLAINLLTQKVAMVAMILVMCAAVLANLTVYIYHKFLR